MTLDANNLTMKLVSIAEDHSDIQGNLSALQAFTGVVPLENANVQYSSPDMVDEQSKNVNFSKISKCNLTKCNLIYLLITSLRLISLGIIVKY